MLQSSRIFRSLAPRRYLIGHRRVAVATSSPSEPPTERLVAHILVRGSDQSSTDRFDKAEAQIAEGAPFEDVCSALSDDNSTKLQGGLLGWLRPGTFYPEFEQAVFSASVGDVVRASTALGRHIIAIKEERTAAMVQQISVQQLSEVLSNPALREDVQFMDVREPWEIETASLPHFDKLYPITSIGVWGQSITTELDPEKETVVLCHHGVRSMQVATFLVSQASFKNVKNVTDGIHAYATQVDRSLQVY